MSGSVPADGALLLRERIEALGHECHVVQVSSELNIKDACERALRRTPELIVAWGGDGTIACVLDAARASRTPVLPVPGGTMNLLHKQVHGHAIDWQDCVSQGLTSGRQRMISAGLVGGEQRFYVGAIFGDIAEIANSRELLREGKPVQAAREFTETTALDLETSLAFRSLDEGEGEVIQRATALAAFVPPNPGQPLDVGSIDPDNLAELAALGLELTFQDWREVESIKRCRVFGIRVHHTHDDTLCATLDGEPVELPSGVRVQVEEESAMVIAAAPA